MWDVNNLSKVTQLDSRRTSNWKPRALYISQFVSFPLYELLLPGSDFSGEMVE